VDYLFIKPLVGLPMKMEVSYQNYWKFERAALDIGHKGMGSSYKHKKYSINTYILTYYGHNDLHFLVF